MKGGDGSKNNINPNAYIARKQEWWLKGNDMTWTLGYELDEETWALRWKVIQKGKALSQSKGLSKSKTAWVIHGKLNKFDWTMKGKNIWGKGDNGLAVGFGPGKSNLNPPNSGPSKNNTNTSSDNNNGNNSGGNSGNNSNNQNNQQQNKPQQLPAPPMP